jgi:3-oxoacyl-[acyl-carrier-protein] synthase II
MIAAEEALTHAQWKPTTLAEKERSGAYIGTGIGCLEEIVDAHRVIHQEGGGGGVRRLTPHFVPKILGNLATGNVSIRHGLQGPNHACITACASGAHAVGDSFRLIQYGDADVMVCGGTEACVNAVSLGGFSRLRALSTKYNEEPDR